MHEFHMYSTFLSCNLLRIYKLKGPYRSPLHCLHPLVGRLKVPSDDGTYNKISLDIHFNFVTQSNITEIMYILNILIFNAKAVKLSQDVPRGGL